MLYFAIGIFLSAFLLFQVFLTGGYAYAYWLVKQKRQGWIHAGVLAGTLALLTALGLVWPSPVLAWAPWQPMQ